MKTLKMNYLLVIALMVGIAFTGCKKDKTSTPLAGADVAATQDAESQDATADNVDNLADNQVDFIEMNNFDVSKQKSAAVLGNSWSCNHPGDTVTFPKI